ncbi:nucleic acid-binding protein [Dendrothele bispora CBS 962.96]|uniref:Nucleic acid-binding protein n=1 Tax=Dendrothele bispora (strain CBS 962.96) TaxID=1314807 RepID=A0A4S8MTK7_DENBC|nr:nucleic acid-binding protein [Dendrothele bispora CBS 962.96]
MGAQKRTLDEPSSQKTKRPKTVKNEIPAASTLTPDDVDFPRGGGTSFTPFEVKNIRAEGLKEANKELFEESKVDDAKTHGKKAKRKSEAKATSSKTIGEKNDKIRIEHLNYKRINVGMKIFAQIVSIQPLALIVSLPNQLLGHIPITNISSQLTSLLEKMDEDEEESGDEDEEDEFKLVPDLLEIFRVGQYVRAVVTANHAPGTTDVSGIGRSRDEVARASRRVELSLVPERVNVGVQKSDLKSGFTLSASVKSVEDHGYSLELGIPDVSGFLPFKDANLEEDGKLRVGQLVDATVTTLSKNGRMCNVSIDSSAFASSSTNEISNISSVLPGSLVQALITAVHPTGLNLQVLGFFDGTVDEFHLPKNMTEKSHKIGKKIKARVLYDIPSTSPPRLALALNEHVIKLKVRKSSDVEEAPTLSEAYPVGTIINDVKVTRIAAEQGLTVEIKPGVDGFVHISSISDDHLPSLSNSGPWKVGSLHRSRVIGYYHFDGLLQLSLKPSVLEQKYVQVQDIQVGEVIKGTIKKLTDSGLFVNLSGNIDGVVWPNHYADIALKHPAKRFKAGGVIKCRVLVVDPEKKRVSLTAKKTLVDSTLPIISALDDAKVGTVTHAVVFKVLAKSLMVEFFNNVKAVVPIKEVSEEPVQDLSKLYTVGKIVKVSVLSVDKEQKSILASIRQSGTNSQTFNEDISDIEISSIVEGEVVEIHKENAVLALQPSHIRALISIKNLANHRGETPAQLRVALKAGEKLEDLVVVSKNSEKNLVIVANKPKTKPSLAKGALSIDTVEIGQIVGGRVIRHTRHGSLIKLPSHVGGLLPPTDVSDDYASTNPFPAPESILKAAVVSIDKDKKQLTLSTRQSRLYPNQSSNVVDIEINDINDLHVGQTIRGFVKSVVEHGVFVTVGRNIDARVQIRELFDEYVKNWKPRFKEHQLVKGRILAVDIEGKKVEMTFRSGDLTRSASLKDADFTPGQIVDGTVKRIEDYGLFIQIQGSKITGLCHKSELSDNKDADASIALHGFRENDRVRAVVLDVKDRRISFSLKPSLLAEDDQKSDSDEDEDSPEGLGVMDVSTANAGRAEEDEEDEEPDNDGSEEESDDDDAMAVDIDFQPQVESSKSTARPVVQSSGGPLIIDNGFQWFGTSMPADVDDASDISEDTDDEAPAKKKKKKRKMIEKDLTADMHTKAPESNADFERLLLGSPNSSYLWIQYMSFQLQLSEIDKAREIGRRALQTINFREEQEKLNVWTALLNLENVYGTEDSLDKVFKEAARANDSKTIHLRLASILDQSDKQKKAEDQYKKTCKKFGYSSKVWTLFAEHYLRRGEVEESRKLLPRSLQSLEKRKHLKTISKFAQLEYKLGEPERGKTLFEGIVDSHPKRWDLWSVYIDMEAGQSNIQSIRNLFERTLQQKMTSHKAKAFFKKWLELERRIGDEEGAEVVKQKAIEWTQKSNSAQ